MPGLSRRKFLRGLAGTIGVVAAGPTAWKHIDKVKRVPHGRTTVGPGVELHARNIAANQAFVRAAGEADYRRLATKYLKKARDVLQEGVEGARRPGSPRKRALRGLADALKELGK